MKTWWAKGPVSVLCLWLCHWLFLFKSFHIENIMHLQLDLLVIFYKPVSYFLVEKSRVPPHRYSRADPFKYMNGRRKSKCIISSLHLAFLRFLQATYISMSIEQTFELTHLNKTYTWNWVGLCLLLHYMWIIRHSLQHNTIHIFPAERIFSASVGGRFKVFITSVGGVNLLLVWAVNV